MTTVSTKSIYDAKNKEDGLRVLITRYYPRGVKRDRFDLWLKGASPTIDLLKAYRSGSIDWSEFRKRFSKQLNGEAESKMAIKELLDLAKKRKNVTLLCYEREGQNCHRQIVKAKLDRSLRTQ
jgi:uncharacterized protein YeaO (DUF488 family)